MATPPKDLHDILILVEDAQLLNANVLNKTFTIKTSFGNITAKTREIVHITMERGLPHEMVINSGNVLRGKIQDRLVTAVIFTGDTVDFKPESELLSIQFLDNLHPSLKKKVRTVRNRRGRR